MNQQAKETYNGWANYETWLVYLWISNDRTAYVHWRDRTKEILIDSKADEIRAPLGILADEVRNEIEASCEMPKANLAADLMTAALSRVDWHELAQALIDSEKEFES